MKGESKMSSPRIFVSSTYYDLKHVRSSLENFIEQLGFESILSEKGDIAYAPDIALDESCYREVCNADIFVLIVGGRYGAEKSQSTKKIPKHFYDRYDSITKQEYKSAVEKNIPTYILIEKNVYADFETYLKNKSNETISYAHVDSISIFYLIEEIFSQPRNNPMHHFDRYSEIEEWLKGQWAGLFKELLTRMNNQQQFTSLSSQVKELSEVTKTLKTYLEQVVTKVAPDDSAEIIKIESKRLREALQLLVMEKNGLVKYLIIRGVDIKAIRNAALSSKTLDEFLKIIKTVTKDIIFDDILIKYKIEAERDYNKLKFELDHAVEIINNKEDISFQTSSEQSDKTASSTQFDKIKLTSLKRSKK